jgi:hypothetical protein
MSQTLFKRVDYTLNYLVSSVEMGDIGLPDIQRPFVWSNAKVRDLFDSMFRGFPVGYLLLWANAAAPKSKPKQIGIDAKEHTSPATFIIDGQQRLTSLYAVMKGKLVLDDEFKERRIRIAFKPLDGSFDVTTAIIQKDAEWIPDISEVFVKGTNSFVLINAYVNALKTTRVVTDGEIGSVASNVERLLQLREYPFSALEVNADTDEEAVADIFVRVNNQGQRLVQADFILTLLSVFWNDGRRALEDFARRSGIPPQSGEKSPYNHHIRPNAEQLLRVAIAVGLRRARLKNAYQFLRGKDLDSGQFTAEARDQQFAKLRAAQDRVLNLTRWHEFLKVLVATGYRRGSLISSETAILYCYVFFLIGADEYKIDSGVLRRLIGRLFMMATVTSRYSGSSETQMDEDLARLRSAKTPDDFVATLTRLIEDNLTNDFWQVGLPNEFESSSANSAVLHAYHAAQNLLGCRVLFSAMKVSDLMDPMVKAPKEALERHHLFPKAYLQGIGFTEIRDTNQIANYALVEWSDNIEISDKPPAEYVPVFEAKYSPDEVHRFYVEHALPDGWYKMEYPVFLSKRRKLMAAVIRKAFEQFSTLPATAG